MADDPIQTSTILLSEQDVAAHVAALARRIAPRIDDETVLVCLLTGGLWFAADLSRALAREGRHVRFDALWLASYGDGRTSQGQVQVRAPCQRTVRDRRVLIVDDVFDSGLTLEQAARMMRDEGALEVLTCVFAAKPWPSPRSMEPDFVGWEAPARYLVGYGLDSGGRLRGLPDIRALD